MAPPRIEKIITALDVGSWKVCALIAGQTADGQLHVLGTGQRESRGVQRGYVADMSRINLAERRGPSSIAACQLCAGVAAIETLKLLLGRGGVRLAPKGSHFDGYRMRYSKTWRPWGHRNPLQRLMISLVKAQLARTK